MRTGGEPTAASTPASKAAFVVVAVALVSEPLLMGALGLPLRPSLWTGGWIVLAFGAVMLTAIVSGRSIRRRLRELRLETGAIAEPVVVDPLWMPVGRIDSGSIDVHRDGAATHWWLARRTPLLLGGGTRGRWPLLARPTRDLVVRLNALRSASAVAAQR